MKKGLLMIVLLVTLIACSTEEQGDVVEQNEEQQNEVLLENHYADCTVETCSQEMLVERYYVVKATKDSYFGESVDIKQALVDLYDVSIAELEEYERLQESIISAEELIEADNPFYDVQDYIDGVVRCKGQCQSKFISYEESSSLSSEEALALVRENSGSYNVGSSTGSSNLNTTKGTCKEISGNYTSQGLTISSCSYSSSKGKISITVENNSGVDLSYLEVEIFGLDSNGKTVLSDYTNHGSTIRNGASQTLETYVDYADSYEVEISSARAK